jgi:hypothetical protein
MVSGDPARPRPGLLTRIGLGRARKPEADEERAEQPRPGAAVSVDPAQGVPLGFDALSGEYAVSETERRATHATASAAEPDPGAGDASRSRQEVDSMPPSSDALDASVCTRCGHANLPGSRFCSNCGNPLVGAGQRPAEVTSTMAISAINAFETEATGETGEVPAYEESPVASLVVRRGPNAGSRFPLNGDVTTAGRSPDSEIFLDDVTVSRAHAEVVRTAQGFLVRDVGSLNGTYVNRERIEELLLSDGDEVQIGKYRLVFHAGRG